MKNEDRRKQTIRQLLDATKELLREKSCHAITMKDIMEKSELSKGAIFHYVKSKDEIFTWVLQERLEETNQHFLNEVSKYEKTFDGPMQIISNNLAGLEDAHEATNKILVYLLGREDEPAVAEVLHRFYERSVDLSKQWILIGQQHGVIQESVDPNKTAEMFVLLGFGMRVRASLPAFPVSFAARDLSSFMIDMLKKY
ncbi:TetR/AcrR family transcriptional regulator [Paenibacillaceae bacterium]|nr:TetR/AcrR family transcriptional regulator [Paenibacillaceae bacterium]